LTKAERCNSIEYAVENKIGEIPSDDPDLDAVKRPDRIQL